MTSAFPATLLQRGQRRESGAGVQRGPISARWLLASEEIDVSIRAPHAVRAVQESFNLQSTTFGSMTDAEMSSMMTTSQPRTIAVTAEWRARNNRDDIRGDSEKLKRLAKHEPKVRRHPLILFRWAHLHLEGWVSNLSFDWIDGVFDSPPYLPQAFLVRLTVMRAQPRVLERTSRFERFTKYRRLGAGETFDSLAFAEYGDPDLGNTLRRHNPQIALTGEVPGDVVRIFEPTSSIIQQGDPQPQSPALGGSVHTLLQLMAEERLSVRGPGLAALEAELGLS